MHRGRQGAHTDIAVAQHTGGPLPAVKRTGEMEQRRAAPRAPALVTEGRSQRLDRTVRARASKQTAPERTTRTQLDGAIAALSPGAEEAESDVGAE